MTMCLLKHQKLKAVGVCISYVTRDLRRISIILEAIVVRRNFFYPALWLWRPAREQITYLPALVSLLPRYGYRSVIEYLHSHAVCRWKVTFISAVLSVMVLYSQSICKAKSVTDLPQHTDILSLPLPPAEQLWVRIALLPQHHHDDTSSAESSRKNIVEEEKARRCEGVTTQSQRSGGLLYLIQLWSSVLEFQFG